MIEFGDAVSHAEQAKLVAIGAESIGLDDLGAGIEVALVDVEDGVWDEGVELVHAALRADGFIKQRAHGAVNDQDGVAKTFVEGFNLHRVTVGLEFCMVVNRRVYHLEASAPTPVKVSGYVSGRICPLLCFQAVTSLSTFWAPASFMPVYARMASSCGRPR